MEVLMQLMMVGIFVVVVAAAYKLVKTSKDHSRDESAREAFLQALCEETARKKRERDENKEPIPSVTNVAPENQESIEPKKAEPVFRKEISEKDAAVNMVMNMLGGSKSRNSAASELQDMMRTLSQKNNQDRNE